MSVFGLAPGDAAKKQFGCSDFIEGADRFRWVLIQVQASCDYAQRQPGPLPFVLALEMPQASAITSSLAAAIWKSPAVGFNGTIRCLRANSRFQKTFPDAAASGIAPLYRLREQLLNELVYHLHSYGARPGYVSFREIKSKVLQPAAAVPKPARPAPPVGGSEKHKKA